MPCSNGCALMWVRVSWGGLSIYTDKCYLDVYRGYLLGKRFPEFFLRKGLTLGKELLLSLAGPDNQLLAMAQESEKNVKEN